MPELKEFIVRKFTKGLELIPDKTVYDLFEWKKVDVVLKDYKTNSILYEEKDLEFPSQYSQNACDIIASKYFKRANVPNDRGKEYSLKQVVHRMVDFWTRSALEEGLIDDSNKRIFYDEVGFVILNQMVAPNSPQWFNTGLDLYDTGEESDGHYYFDEKEGKVVQAKDKYSRTQASACFIIGIEDKLLGDKSISEQYITETRLFKHGSGTGTNFSTLRAKGEKLTGGGTSSGVMSFLKGFDANAGGIKSGGTTRRAAKMVELDVDHPEILDFIQWKAKEEEKVKALGKMGYDTDFDGEAYSTVSGQNSNNSVRFTNEFMQKVEKLKKTNKDSDHLLKGRVDESVNKTIKVSEIWNEFNRCSWECADPAPQFSDTFNAWHTCPAGEDDQVWAKHNQINSTNPCFRGDMRILTTEGYIPIENLDGQIVKIINKDGTVSEGKVWCSGEKDIYKVRLSNKKEIYCTKDHVFMTADNEEIQAINLKGKKIMPYLNNNIEVNKEFVLYGFMQGDGDLGRLKSEYHQGIEVNIGDKDQDIAEYFMLDVNKKKVYLIGFKERLTELGFCPNQLPERIMPTTINTWNALDKKSFLRGLYSANGSVLSCGRITFKTTCKQMAEQVKDLLNEFDIDSYITTNKAHNVQFSNGEYTCKESYDVNINRFEEKVKFYNNIGFLQKYKVERLKETLIDTAPYVTLITFTGTKEKVYDFSEPLTHWGVVEGYIAHNCSEYAFLDDTSCNLASINILRFYDTETGIFNYELYSHTILLSQIVLEATVNKGQFPTEDVARKTHLFRTTGLGIANLSGLLLVLGLPYDSDEARAISSGLMSVCTGYSYFTSSLMAKQVGTFAKYDINKPYMLEVIRNHARVSGARDDKYERLTYKPIKLNHTLLNNNGFKELSKLVKNTWNDTVNLGEKYGFRNAQVTVIAPTGTIAFAMDCEATSTEPFFAHTIYKKLAGGGGMSIINPLMPEALEKLGYTEDQIQIINDKILKGEIESCKELKPEHLPIFDTANKCGKGQRFIQPMGHVEMMGALTPMVSGAISKTVNLPNNATIEDFEQVHLEAWKLGIKGIALYRDNCKASQPLNSCENTVTETKFEDMKYSDLVKITYDLQSKTKNPTRIMPEGIIEGRKHIAIIDGLKLHIKVFRYAGTDKIAEVYITADKEGTLVKGLLDAVSKQTSKMFQYNIPVNDIIKTLKGQKYEPHGFVTGHPYIKYADSISDLVAKIFEIEIGDYSSCQVKPQQTQIIKELSKTAIIEPIKEDVTKGEKIYGKTCSTCGSTHIRKNGTCFVCEDCGSTSGCS